MDRDRSIARGVGFGIAADVAAGVVDAYERISTRAGTEFDPAAWTKTVWLAEADRWQRSPNAEAHATLVLHLRDLSDSWEAKAARGARGWNPGKVGERLTVR